VTYCVVKPNEAAYAKMSLFGCVFFTDANIEFFVNPDVES